MRLSVGHQHCQFWSILARFMDYYSLLWGLGVISTINEHWSAFTCGHQHWQFWPILAPFMDYYPPFWAPEAIALVIEPQGALMCRSSTLEVLVDSGPFHGLFTHSFGVPE